MKVELSLNCDGTWIDYTTFVDLKGLKITKNLNEDNDPIKFASTDIEMFGSAYQFYFDNIINSPDIYSNSICVKLTDNDCSNTELYFKTDSNTIKWCDNDDCIVFVNLIQHSEVLDCIKQTPISDNALGRFDIFSPLTIPKFRYCDVIKPTFMFGAILTAFNAIDSSIIAPLNGIFSVINGILGTSLSIGYLGLSMVGCDRVHPSPFIKDYVSNACDICDVVVDSTTSPIFHNPLITLGGSVVENPYFQACLMTAYNTKGFKQGYPATQYLQSNRPSWTLDVFSSIVKKFFNARWFIHGNRFYFERKDKIGELIWGAGYQLDLTDSDTKEQLLGNVCYSWNGKTKPKRYNWNYGLDATDTIGNEMKKRFNGEYIEPSTSLNYTDTKTTDVTEISAPSFVLDGQDSHWDAILTKSVASTLSGNPFKGCLKMLADTAQNAKILIFDGIDTEDARTIRTPYDNYGSAGADLQEFQNDDANFFPISSSDCFNYNYPMSFSPLADGISSNYNLFEFNQIETAQNDKKTNITFNFTLNFCCSYSSLDIYQKVKLSTIQDGEITEVVFDYDKREINVKGNLI